jgi:hypothetical protein
MSTAAIPVHIALVDESGRYTAGELAEVAGALSEQIARDFSPVWHVKATVAAYPLKPEETWAIVVQEKLDDDVLGYHTDDLGQPISFVDHTGDDTSITISHELLEMLVDPWGSRPHSARLPQSSNGEVRLEDSHSHFGCFLRSSRVRYLLEVADPCEATAYEIGGVAVSDFLLPEWYRTTRSGQTPVTSFAGGTVLPREVADGGYVSFCNHHGEWFQVYNNNRQIEIAELGKYARAKHDNLRAFTDAGSRRYRKSGQS